MAAANIYKSRFGLILLLAVAILCILAFYPVQSVSGASSFHGLLSQKLTNEEPTWFIWTGSAAHLRQRREIIRSTWQTIYQNVSYEARFVIGKPDPMWLPVIKQENVTYGDIIMLESDSDDKSFATTLKPFEMCKYLRNQALATGKKWTFVSKIDDDSYLDALTFRNRFLVPNQHSTRKIISRVIQYSRPHVFPGGQFYTLTWDLVDIIARLYETTARDLVSDMADGAKRKLTKRHEDFMIADLMLQAGEQFEYIELNDEEAFDVVKQGNVTAKAINPHRMKTDEQYLLVAGMYDEKGYRGSQWNGIDLEEELWQTATSQ